MNHIRLRTISVSLVDSLRQKASLVLMMRLMKMRKDCWRPSYQRILDSELLQMLLLTESKKMMPPLLLSGSCTLREAVIIGTIIEKVSIPSLHSSVALLKLAEMGYCGTTSYFIKLLIEKKYALPYRVLDSLVAHFMRFLEETRIMPVIWHQSLLAFV
ncbi:hypothetical protein Ancab_007688 [Ancistrocladus abbreviatus]